MGRGGRGWGDPLHCPLADPLEYLGFPRMTWQKVSEDKVLGIQRYAKGRENGQRLRALFRYLAWIQTGKVVTGGCQRDMCTGRQRENWRRWKPRAGYPVKSQ